MKITKTEVDKAHQALIKINKKACDWVNNYCRDIEIAFKEIAPAYFIGYIEPWSIQLIGICIITRNKEAIFINSDGITDEYNYKSEEYRGGGDRLKERIIKELAKCSQPND